MKETFISWTEYTWNPVTGCSKISAGCKNCYAEKIANELQAKGNKRYEDGFCVRIHPDLLDFPYKMKEGKEIFVNSMSDLFHKNVPLEFIKKVFRVMNDNPQHVFQILTKRPERLLECDHELRWTKNIWMGVSVENEVMRKRIDLLRQCNAKVKFLSIEPLLGPLNYLNLEGIDWVIVGGEKADNPRPMKEEWILDIQKQCKEQNVHFYFKQWGGRNIDGSCLLRGKEYKAKPEYEPPFFEF